MSPKNENKTGLSVDFGDELSKNLTIHKNVKQEIIITTEDKIKLVLINTKEKLTAQRDWWTPFGLLLSFIVTFSTSDFKDTLGLSKDFWKALFVLLSIASAIWLFKALYKLLKNWGENYLDNVIESIKLKNTSSEICDDINIESEKLILKIAINDNWNLNHWGKNYAKINNGKMVFEGQGTILDPDGSHINQIDLLEVGKKYKISCFAKSTPNTEGLFQLWVHDNFGTEPKGSDEKTSYKTPAEDGEVISLNFTAKYNKNLRIHLQYTPGKGTIEVSNVEISEL